MNTPIKLNDKTHLKMLRLEIDAALESVTQKLGLTSLKSGNISFDADGCSAKIQLKVEAPRADGKTKEQLDLENFGDLYGVPPSSMGRTFQSKGETFMVVGLMPNRRKFPVLAVGRDNRRVLFTTDVVKKLS